MATVIDALVMTLGLDTKGLKKGERETTDTNRRLREDANRTQKAYELAGARVAQSITSARNAALGLAGVFTAGVGLASFIRQTTESSAAVGRMARDLNMSTQALSAWEGVSRRVGNAAGEVTGAFAAIQNQIQQFRLLGGQGLSPAFRALNVALVDAAGNTRDNEAIYRDVLEALARRPAQERLTIAQALGMGQETVNLAAVPAQQRNAMLVEQRRLGVVSPEQAAAAQRRQQAWLDFQQALQTTANRLLTDFTPAIVAVLEKLRDFGTYISGPAFRPAFEAIEAAVRRVTNYLGSQAFLTDVEAFINAVREMSDGLVRLLRWLRIIPASAEAAEAEQPRVVGPDGTNNWVLDRNGQPVPAPPPRAPNPAAGVAPAAVQGAAMGGAAGTIAAQQNQQTAFNFFRARGWTAEQAAAIVGNTMGETQGLDVNAFNPGGGGRGAMGIGQWRGPRIAAFEARYGRSPLGAPLEMQLDFMDWELRNSHRAVGDALARTTDARVGADILHRRYSIPGEEDRSGPRRQANALGVLQRAQTPAPGPAPAPATASVPPVAAPGRQMTPAEQAAAAQGVRIPRMMPPAEAAAAAQGVTLPPPTIDPNLVPGADGAALRDNTRPNQTSNNEANIGTINVQTAATDAGGIARDIGAAMRRVTFVDQVTTGLA